MQVRLLNESEQNSRCLISTRAFILHVSSEVVVLVELQLNFNAKTGLDHGKSERAVRDGEMFKARAVHICFEKLGNVVTALEAVDWSLIIAVFSLV